MRSLSLRTRRSLIDLSDLAAEEFHEIFARAATFEARPPERRLAGTACVNIFFEPSTRTFTSFNLAELRLGADVVNLTPSDLSYLHKGETIEDTVITLGAMGIGVLVVRHPREGFVAEVAQSFDGHVVNAGDGTHAHPTQALLDIFTLLEEFKDVAGRTVLIVGDVLHSRVSHSLVAGLRRLDVQVVLVGPEAFVPDEYAQPGVRVERDFDQALGQADAIVLLRLQRERFAAMPMSDEEYVARYCLNRERLAHVRETAVVMHPGPYNRGIELADCVLQFPGWRYAKQVMHGVAVRMAVLDLLVHGT
jgi:aspartate carbamoyltransferase catalytic subunit